MRLRNSSLRNARQSFSNTQTRLRPAEVAPLRDWTGCKTRVQTEDGWRRTSSGGRPSGRSSSCCSLIKGEATLVDACREHDLKQSEVEGWMEAFLQAGERGLKARSEDEQAVHEREARELRAKVGELVLELDARKKLDALTGKPEKAF